MKPLCSLLFTLLAVALIALSGGVSLAAAHPAQGGTQMVICSENGPQTITVDANGQPVAPAKTPCSHCPDCLPTPIAALGGGDGFAAHRPAGRWIATRLTGRKIAPQHWAAPIARGPPVHSFDDIFWSRSAILSPRGPAHRAQPMVWFA